MKYKILTSVVMETLERNVQNYLENGWSLQGSPFIDTINSYPRYAQAVIYEDYDTEGHLDWLYDQIAGPNQ